MGARSYDPNIGRWIQPDSIIPDVYNPQSLNRYAYVNNNPVSHTDPSGHGIPEDLWASLQRLWRMLTDRRYARSQACGGNVDPSCGSTNVSPSVTGLIDTANKSAQEKLKHNFGPPITNPETLKAIKLATQLGQWTAKNEGMSESAQRYQEYVTGTSGYVFKYNGYDFDGFNGNALLDAKDHYEGFINPETGYWKDFWVISKSGVQGFLEDAKEELEAAQGTPIEWHFSEKGPADLVKDLFEEEGIEGIEVIYDPLPGE